MRIQIRAFGEQLFDDIGIPRACRHHQRRFAREQRRVRIGARLQQPPDHGRTSVLAGRPQRRDAEIGGRVHLGAGANQQIGAFEVVVITGPMQRRGAIGIGGVDVRLLLEQRAQSSLVAALGGVHQRRTADIRRCYEEHRQCHQDQALPTA